MGRFRIRTFQQLMLKPVLNLYIIIIICYIYVLRSTANKMSPKADSYLCI